MLFPIFRQKTHEASTAAAWRASVSRETNGKLSASGLRSEHHAQRASASAQLETREGAARTVWGEKLPGLFIAEEEEKTTAAELQNTNN